MDKVVELFDGGFGINEATQFSFKNYIYVVILVRKLCTLNTGHHTLH